MIYQIKSCRSTQETETAETRQNCRHSYLKSGWWYELCLTLILSRKTPFLDDLSVLKAVDQHIILKLAKTAKTAETAVFIYQAGCWYEFRLTLI